MQCNSDIYIEQVGNIDNNSSGHTSCDILKMD